MSGKKIYLDACSWCRPFDDLSQPRVYIESEAVLEILRLCKLRGWTVAGSEAIEIELLRMKDTEKLDNVKDLYEDATEYLTLTDEIMHMAQHFQQHRIGEFDSLHLATAEANGYDVLLTTDDDFRRNALKLSLDVRVNNPAEWLMEVLVNAADNG
jgi:predicted nucleic acid-binding protein